MADLKAFAEQLVNLTVKEVNELAQILKEEYGIEPAAAAVAVGVGVFMQKFSFGDEERIRTGKNIIRGSLFSYAFILLLDLILSAINGLLG